MAGWSSLPGDLITLIADRLLGTNDLDSYLDIRAVCHGWRSSTADPRKSPRDPRFQLRQWVMLDEVHQSDARLFVNAATGRFVRKDLPVLRRYFFVAGTGGGSLALAERRSPHAACLLNPFTGSLVQFKAPVPPELKLEVAAHVIGWTLVMLRHSDTTIYWTDPSSESFIEFKEKHFDHRLASQALVGGIYAAASLEHGSLATILHPTVNKISGLVKTRPPFTNNFWRHASSAWNNCFLVESAGEILIVFKLRRGMKVCIEVFEIAADSNALEPVTNIGNRAIFVGDCRFLSVDAEKFTSVEANCIYYAQGSWSYYVCSLEDENEVRGGGAA